LKKATLMAKKYKGQGKSNGVLLAALWFISPKGVFIVLLYENRDVDKFSTLTSLKFGGAR